MSGYKKFNIKDRMHLPVREARYISFEDDLIRDVLSRLPQFNENQIRHVLHTNIRTIKTKAKEPECFAIATPIGEFYLKAVYMEKVKEAMMDKVLKGTATRTMRDKIRKYVYKLQIYKEKRSYWADVFGMYKWGRGRKTYVHDLPSKVGMYPYSKKEKEELQNMLY